MSLMPCARSSAQPGRGHSSCASPKAIPVRGACRRHSIPPRRSCARPRGTRSMWCSARSSRSMLRRGPRTTSPVWPIRTADPSPAIAAPIRTVPGSIRVDRPGNSSGCRATASRFSRRCTARSGSRCAARSTCPRLHARSRCAEPSSSSCRRAVTSGSYGRRGVRSSGRARSRTSRSW